MGSAASHHAHQGHHIDQEYVKVISVVVASNSALQIDRTFTLQGSRAEKYFPTSLSREEELLKCLNLMKSWFKTLTDEDYRYFKPLIENQLEEVSVSKKLQ